MRVQVPRKRFVVQCVLLAALSLVAVNALLGSSASADSEEVALATQYAEETTTSSTSTTIDQTRDVPVPPGAINASGGSLGPSTIFIASVLLGLVIVGSMISGSSVIGQKKDAGSE